MKPETELQDGTVQGIRLPLPGKIAGIVFWGMVLVGLVIAVFQMQLLENQLEKQYQIDAKLFVYELENILEQNPSPDAIDAQLKALLSQSQFHNTNLKYSFSYKGRLYQSQSISDELQAFHLSLHIHGAKKQEDNLVHVTVYMPSIDQQLIDIRKNMLISIGSLVLIFGFILQQILQRMLSRPFSSMVKSAEEFAEGNSHVRFDESRHDEFGYLSGFINKALDSVLRHQQDLEASRQELALEKERAEVTLNSIMDGVISVDDQGRVQYMNPVAERLTGYKNADIMNRPLSDVIALLHEDSGDAVALPLHQCLHENCLKVLGDHVAMLHISGETVSIEASLAPMCNAQGEVIGAVMVFQDVSHARKLRHQLSFQASHDALTGLFNRRKFEEVLEDALLDSQQNASVHALCYIDLDQFKIVNDTCGHMAGDELLRQLSVQLSDSIREGDTLARLGGDEFGVLLEHCHLKQAQHIAEKILKQVKAFRFVWEDKSFDLGASIGVVDITENSASLNNILTAADMACYIAKESGRNRVHIYEPSDEAMQSHQGQMHWVSRIKEALEDHHFVLYQQPVVALNPDYTNKHCELLIRMQDKQGQIISPNAFIPAAERYNLMMQVDRWVIHQAFTLLSENKQHAGARLAAINLSGNSLSDDGLLEYIVSASEQHGIDLHEICFEITETAAIGNLVKALKFMKELNERGCKFALDDFGSGLSSFAYLKNLPVDYLKIDGSFVREVARNMTDLAMVEAITRLGHVMDMQIIAEWVEDEQTLQKLKDIGVDFVQGYYLGKPEKISGEGI